jgi:hypothetical protein
LSKRIKEFRLEQTDVAKGQAAKFFGIERTHRSPESNSAKNCSELTKAKIDQVFAQQSHEQAA